MGPVSLTPDGRPIPGGVTFDADDLAAGHRLGWHRWTGRRERIERRIHADANAFADRALTGPDAAGHRLVHDDDRCAAIVGLLFGGDPWLLTALCLIWGIAIVADSAQFSASVAELSERALVGTMLTLQTALGFTLTLVTIHLMPALVEALGWRWAFAPLAIGPFLGVWAMARLRAHPRYSEAARVAR